MKHWTLEDAQAQLDDLVEAAEAGEVQVITEGGKAIVVVLSAGEYRRLRGGEKSVWDVLSGGPDLGELDLARDPSPPREVDL